MIPSALFFLKIVLAIWSLWCFHTNFRIVYSISVKNAIGILIEIVLNLYIALGSVDILTILILLIHEHSISLPLFVSSSISFISVLQLSFYRFVTSLVKFIPRYLFLFDATANGIVFLTSLSDSLLLVYTKATDFCIFILYPATLN